jgi:four helix bundle protein
MGRQLIRSSTGTAANYRAACRARSRREFAARIGVALEESDESAFWLDMLVRADLVPLKDAAPLRDEAMQLTAIFSASRRTALARMRATHGQQGDPIHGPDRPRH